MLILLIGLAYQIVLMVILVIPTLKVVSQVVLFRMDNMLIHLLIFVFQHAPHLQITMAKILMTATTHVLLHVLYQATLQTLLQEHVFPTAM